MKSVKTIIKNILKSLLRRKKSYKIATLLLLITLVIFTILFLQERAKVRNLTSANREIEKIINQAGQLIILPRDLKPNIATIENVEKLKEKEPNFYKNAENGDKLLLYPNQVILYSPKRNIIVNVAPIIPENQKE